MSSINKKITNTNKTHEGGQACHLTPEQQLRRSVLTCLLWEDNCYEGGKLVADRIAEIIPKVNSEVAVSLMKEAKEKHKLRHVPLFMARELARHGKIKAEDICRMIKRADEITEFLALYWKDGKCPISRQVKLGLAMAFHKFDEHQFSKHNRDKEIKLRDVMFMVHPIPQNGEQAALFNRIATNTLKTPDTWEVGLSAGGKKKETFGRLLEKKKLGYLATLRNLRNMVDSGVDTKLIRDALKNNVGRSKIMPLQFLQAAKAVPVLEDVIEAGMFKSLENFDKLIGKTVFLVDVSGSMYWKGKASGSLNGIGKAGALAMMMREICDEVAIYAFSNEVYRLKPRRGMALLEQFDGLPYCGTYMWNAIGAVQRDENYDRMIVFTDEQVHDSGHLQKKGLNYCINIQPNRRGVGYQEKGFDMHIDGFSESVIQFIQMFEKEMIYG